MSRPYEGRVQRTPLRRTHVAVSIATLEVLVVIRPTLTSMGVNTQHQACLWRCHGEWFRNLPPILSSPDRLSPVLETGNLPCALEDVFWDSYPPGQHYQA